MKHLEGIKSLKVNKPIGAHVTLGRKKPGGGVVEKDMFHFVSTLEDSNKVKPYLPEFNEYHRLKPEFRRMIKATLIYGKLSQCFTHRLRLLEFPKHWPAPRARPKHIPVCEGGMMADGRMMADRWVQKEDKTERIVCPDDQCEFRLCDPPLCKPFTEFVFQPRWDGMDLPSPVCLMRSPTGWSSAANIAGFFNDLHDQAAEVGMPDATFFGFPFTIRLVQKTNPAKGRKWWAIALTPDENIVRFLQWQREAIRQLQEPLRVEAIPDLRDQDDGEVYEDIQSVEVGDG